MCGLAGTSTPGSRSPASERRGESYEAEADGAATDGASLAGAALTAGAADVPDEELEDGEHATNAAPRARMRSSRLIMGYLLGLRQARPLQTRLLAALRRPERP